jgi:hypothetical protein
MASQSAAAANGDDEDEDDYGSDHPPPPPIRFGSGARAPHGSNGVSLLGRTARSPSPAVSLLPDLSLPTPHAASLLRNRLFSARAISEFSPSWSNQVKLVSM